MLAAADYFRDAAIADWSEADARMTDAIDNFGYPVDPESHRVAFEHVE